jgi:peptidoglycan-N-acetylglucosamine deacetylase
MNRPSYPIFYDPRQRRGLQFRRIAIFLTVGLLALLSILTICIFTNPVLPKLNLGVEDRGSLVSVKPKIQTGDRFRKTETISSTNAPLPPTTPTQIAAELPASAAKASKAIGFFVNWDDKSFTALKEHISQIDKLIPEWLHLGTDGKIEIDNLPQQQRVLAYIREHRPNLKIVPLINNYDRSTGNWNQERIGSMLANPKSRQQNINSLLEFVQSNHFAGISIDFENLAPTSQLDLVSFMRELHDVFAPLGLEVSQSVPFNDPTFDYRTLVQFNDYLILMAYDEHSTSQESGSIASQSWYTQNLAQRLIDLPASKYVVAIGNYGYDWHNNDVSTVTVPEAIQIARKFNREIKLDPISLTQTFDYDDDRKEHHQVHVLDAVTGFNQVAIARKQGIKGFALWRLGAEDPSIWQVFDRQLDPLAAKSLETVPNGYDLNYQGKGEVLKVIDTPKEGKRKVSYDRATGLIVKSQFIRYPSPYEIDRWGGKDRQKIALTFDDGPSSEYTGGVLDILKQYHVPATFFVVGMYGEQNPNLLHRIVDEGHEIGSHTFTHPNISRTSKEQLIVELNATERVFESYLGRRTLLFRPPYARDMEPDTPAQVAPIEFTSSLGYYTIGLNIDPFDWKNPGVDRIVTETIKQAVAGKGNIVLLHDSGGDRSQTVAALPQIIQGLRDRGFKLVTVSNLLGLNRDAVMPFVLADETMLASSNFIVFQMFSWFSWLIYYLFIFGIGFSILRLIFISGLALYQPDRHKKNTFAMKGYYPLVSVVVAAFNEEKVICKTIQSLLNSDYPNLEVIIIDDGSKDLTYHKLLREFLGSPRVEIFHKVNGGKSTAINYGIERSKADIVITIDADTILHPIAISQLVRHFADDRVAAVAGNIKVGNRVNLLTHWQSLEYITSQNLERRALSVLNGIGVVPGAIGAWRRKYLLAAGGFTHDTLAEDADLTLTLLRMGYKVCAEESAIAYTEAPENINSFLKQRFRWMFGTFQAIWKHRDAILRPQYGAMGMITLPNLLIFQVVLSLVSPLMDVCMVTSLWWTSWQKQQHPEQFSPDMLLHMSLYYLLFIAVDYLAAVIAFSLEPTKEDWSQLIWLFPQRFFYRQLMYFVAIKAVLAAIQGQLVGWNKLERKASVLSGAKEFPLLPPGRSPAQPESFDRISEN